MEVLQATDDGRLHLDLRPTAEERGLLGRDNCSIEVAAGWSPDGLHPDLLALALVLLCRPATRGRLVVPRPVSSAFAEVVAALAGLELAPVDDQLAPRHPPGDGVPGLCFSGGVDSVAALMVLPDRTRSYFLERRAPAGAPATLLRPDAGRSAALGIAAQGRAVRVVSTDLEYLRDPPGFPEHLANAVPALLHADMDGLATIAWGMVLESAYRVGRARFVEYLDRGYNRRWHTLFAAAGLPMCNPVMGVSEVGTARLVASSPYRQLAQSCVRGPLGAPCNACVKCFRKVVVASASSGQWPHDEHLSALLVAYPVRHYLAQVPLLQPAGLLWSLQRYPGRDAVLLAVRDRLERADQDVGFVPHWYAPAQQHWPQVPWTAEMAAILDGELGRMDPGQEAALQRFDLAAAEQGPAVEDHADAIAYLADRRASLDHGAAVKPSAALVPGSVPPEEFARLQEQLGAARREVEDLRASASYRLGHAVVRPLGRLGRLGRLRGRR